MKIEQAIKDAHAAIATAKAEGTLLPYGEIEDHHGELIGLGWLADGGIADDDIAVYVDRDRITAVINCNGPCGVRV